MRIYWSDYKCKTVVRLWEEREKGYIQIYLLRYIKLNIYNSNYKLLSMGRGNGVCKFLGIRNIDDLSKCDPTDVIKKICDCEKEVGELVKSKKIDKIDKIEAYKDLYGRLEEEIKEFKNKAQKKL